MRETKSWGEMKRIREEPKPCRHCGQVEHERSCIAEVHRIRDLEREVATHQVERSGAEAEARVKEIAGLRVEIAAGGADRDAARAAIQALREKLGMGDVVLGGVVPDPTDPRKTADEAMQDHMDFANAAAEGINEAFEKKGS